MVKFLIIGWSLLAFPVCAANKTPESLQGNSVLGQVLLGLFVVTTLIYFLAWCVKKFSNGSFMQTRGMKLLAAMPLGTREKAVLIEVENKKILLGVSPGGVNMLHVFDNPATSEEKQTVDSLTDAERGIDLSHVTPLANNQKLDFTAYLKNILNHGNVR